MVSEFPYVIKTYRKFFSRKIYVFPRRILNFQLKLYFFQRKINLSVDSSTQLWTWQGSSNIILIIWYFESLCLEIVLLCRLSANPHAPCYGFMLKSSRIHKICDGFKIWHQRSYVAMFNHHILCSSIFYGHSLEKKFHVTGHL